MKIPFAKPLIEKKEIRAVTEVLRSGILTHGKYQNEFEKSFSNFTRIKNSLAVSSCTSALFLAYYLSGLNKDSEFIVPAQTHVATVHAGTFFGAKPIFVDCNPKTGNIDVDLIEKKITKKTKSITVVHFLGKSVDMGKIVKICKKKKIKLIKDCALSLGAKYKNKHVGDFGDFGCFSFYPAKHIATGDGGILTCKLKKNFIKAKLFKGFGVNKTFEQRKVPGEYDVVSLGLNFRMTEMQCALGVEQLKRLSSFIKTREKNFKYLKNGLKDIENIEILSTDSEENFKSSYYCMSIILKEKLKPKRIKIINYLKNLGIGTSIYYPKIIPMFSHYKKKYNYKTIDLKNAKVISNNSICVPVGPHLTRLNLNYIIKQFKKINLLK